MCFVAMLECSRLASCCILDGIVLLIAELCHYCFACHLQIVHPFPVIFISFLTEINSSFQRRTWFSKLRPGSSFPSGAHICIAYYILHIMSCFASCCLRIASWLIVVSFVCVLVFGRAGRRVRVWGARWVCLRGSRQLWELCRQDDHTLEITSIFAC